MQNSKATVRLLFATAATVFATAATLCGPLGDVCGIRCLHAQTSEIPAGLHSILEREADPQSAVPNTEGNNKSKEEVLDRDGDGDDRVQPQTNPELDRTNSEAVDSSQSTTFEETLPAPLPVPLPSDSQSNTSELSDARSIKLSPNTATRIAWPTLPTDLGYEVLLASPVHEALISVAELSLVPGDTQLAPMAPPRPIDETAASPLPAVSQDGGKRDGEGDASPAELSSRGDWIAGYWAWLPESKRFAWISGVRRVAPPGRTWFSGNWGQTVAGYRWTAGYWGEGDNQGANSTQRDSTTQSKELTVADVILPAPPTARDGGPKSASPNEDSFWVPGHWVLRDDWQIKLPSSSDNVYEWRNGYWTQHVDQWIWQPARLVAKEDGYRYVSGYWDYEPQHRGQGYAAIVPSGNSVDDPHFNVQPAYPLSRPSSLLLHLFVQSNRTQLFYGDLYDDVFVELGYRPWYLGNARISADRNQTVDGFWAPLREYYQWKYGLAGVDFTASMARYAQHFRSAPSIRPAAQIALRPELAKREGLAGQVNADAYNEIVMGNVAGRPPLTLDGSPYPSDLAANGQNSLHRSASQNQAVPKQGTTGRTALQQAIQKQSAQSESVAQASATTRPSDALNAVRQASNSLVPNRSRPQGSSSANSLALNPLPPGAAAIGQRGGSAVLVLPGGRIVLAPPGLVPPPIPVGPRIGFAPPGLRIPPPPFSGLRSRIGRR